GQAVCAGALVPDRRRNPAQIGDRVIQPPAVDLGGRAHYLLDAPRDARISSATAGSPPVACSFAAATNSRNSGAGFSGRDLNSGWNCEATKNGWSLSSMISTRRSSGDVPDTTSPAASSLLRSEIDTS